MNNGIPCYLKGLFVVSKEPLNVDNPFCQQGIICCKCSSTRFFVCSNKNLLNDDCYKQIKEIKNKYKDIFKVKGNCLASLHKDDKEVIGYYNNNMEFTKLETIKVFDTVNLPTIVKVKCASCGKEYEIFNSFKNGYDAVISNDTYEGEVPTKCKRPCIKCKSETYQVELTISNTGKRDLFEEGGDAITEENWVDAFDWITIDLKCSECGKRYKKWFDMETM